MTDLIEKVGEIYNEIAGRQKANRQLAGDCKACGKCCDFAEFDHKLFVTPAEIEYLAFHIGSKSIKPMPTSRCPYQKDGKCTIYKHRFAGCRIFCCTGDKDFQSRLSESVLGEFKSLCTQLQLAYQYSDLASALNNFTCD